VAREKAREVDLTELAERAKGVTHTS
jgi:hypothetical protein